MAASLIPMRQQKRAVTYYVDTSTVYTAKLKKGVDALTNLSFTPTLSGYTFVGWREDTTASSSVLSSEIVGKTDITLYAVFAKAITITYYASTTASSVTGLMYYNNGNTSYPSFTIDDAELDDWTFLGWTTSTSATGTVSYTSISDRTFTASVTLYAKFSQTITLSYSGNGSTSGSVSSQTGTRYYNAKGNYNNPTLTLASNGFTKTHYSFTAWAMGSTSGTQYAAGASVTLSADTTFYAIWTIVTYTAKLESYTYYSDSYGVMNRMRLYNASTGTLIATLYHSTSSGTYWYSSKDYFGLLRCTLFDDDNRPISAAPPYLRLTALTTFYSNSGCTSVSLNSGSYTVADVGYYGDTTVTNTWYIPDCSYYA